MKRRAQRIIASAVLASFLPLSSTACFGGFRLTKKVYGFNRTISHDKWVRWITFLVFVCVPVYGFAVAFDGIFANSIE
ncbi:MAG: DUF3332 family protein, partial [Myxococcota bacterium]